MIIGVKKWAIIVGLATVASGFFGAMVGGWKPSPVDPRDCKSSAEIISSADSARHCFDGARIEVWPVGGDHALVKCICPPVAP